MASVSTHYHKWCLDFTWKVDGPLWTVTPLLSFHPIWSGWEVTQLITQYSCLSDSVNSGDRPANTDWPPVQTLTFCFFAESTLLHGKEPYWLIKNRFVCVMAQFLKYSKKPVGWQCIQHWNPAVIFWTGFAMFNGTFHMMEFQCSILFFLSAGEQVGVSRWVCGILLVVASSCGFTLFTCGHAVAVY